MTSKPPLDFPKKSRAKIKRKIGTICRKTIGEETTWQTKKGSFVSTTRTWHNNNLTSPTTSDTEINGCYWFGGKIVLTSSIELSMDNKSVCLWLFYGREKKPFIWVSLMAALFQEHSVHFPAVTHIHTWKLPSRATVWPAAPLEQLQVKSLVQGLLS